MPESSAVDSKRDLWHRDHNTTSSAANFGPPDVLDDGGLITMELQGKPLAFALTSHGGNGHTLSRPQQGGGDMLITSNLYLPSYNHTVDCNAVEKDACFELISRVDNQGSRPTAVVFEWEASSTTATPTAAPTATANPTVAPTPSQTDNPTSSPTNTTAAPSAPTPRPTITVVAEAKELAHSDIFIIVSPLIICMLILCAAAAYKKTTA